MKSKGVNETLKSLTEQFDSYFVSICPYLKSDSIFVKMTPPVNISDVIKVCFDIKNAGRN